MVRIVGHRAFLLRDGVWIDTGFDVAAMTATPVNFLSADYFALLRARPELQAPFALGERVIAIAADGTAYEVVADGAPPIDLPPAVTPGATPAATAVAADATAAPGATPRPGGTPAPATPPGTGAGQQAPGWPVAAICLGAILLPALAGAVVLWVRRVV